MKRVKYLVLTWLLFIPLISVYASQAENQVKALFLYNFANYVEWPKSAFATPKTKLRMCLFGEVEFANTLSVYDGTIIGERELEIFKTNEIAKISKGCHILFVSKEKKSKLPAFFKKIKYLYVLSIGDSDKPSSGGEIISIVRTTDRVQFDIDLSLANANRLTISSDLLSLARRIKRLK